MTRTRLEERGPIGECVVLGEHGRLSNDKAEFKELPSALRLFRVPSTFLINVHVPYVQPLPVVHL